MRDPGSSATTVRSRRRTWAAPAGSTATAASDTAAASRAPDRPSRAHGRTTRSSSQPRSSRPSSPRVAAARRAVTGSPSSSRASRSNQATSGRRASSWSSHTWRRTAPASEGGRSGRRGSGPRPRASAARPPRGGRRRCAGAGPGAGRAPGAVLGDPQLLLQQAGRVVDALEAGVVEDRGRQQQAAVAALGVPVEPAGDAAGEVGGEPPLGQRRVQLAAADGEEHGDEVADVGGQRARVQEVLHPVLLHEAGDPAGQQPAGPDAPEAALQDRLGVRLARGADHDPVGGGRRGRRPSRTTTTRKAPAARSSADRARRAPASSAATSAGPGSSSSQPDRGGGRSGTASRAGTRRTSPGAARCSSRRAVVVRPVRAGPSSTRTCWRRSTAWARSYSGGST